MNLIETPSVKYYHQVKNKGLLWELIKMEIAIRYTKYKAKVSRDSTEEVGHQLKQNFT